MKLNFEEYLNSKGLKIGDEIKLYTGEVCKIYQTKNGEIRLMSSVVGRSFYGLELLGIYEFEKVKPKKKAGDLICYDIGCTECPLHCIACGGCANDTLRERFRMALIKYPELEAMRPTIEKQLEKEVDD